MNISILKKRITKNRTTPKTSRKKENIKDNEEFNPYGKTFYSEIRSWVIKGKR